MGRLRRGARGLSEPGRNGTALRGEEGSASIETAISLTVAFALVFWLFELCQCAYSIAVLDDAVAEGIRYAVVHGSDSSNCSGPTTGCADSSGANVSTVVTTWAKLTLHNMSGMTVSVSWPESTGCKPGSLVTVTATYPYVAMIKGLSFSPTVVATAQGRIIY